MRVQASSVWRGTRAVASTDDGSAVHPRSLASPAAATLPPATRRKPFLHSSLSLSFSPFYTLSPLSFFPLNPSPLSHKSSLASLARTSRNHRIDDGGDGDAVRRACERDPQN